MKTAQKWLIGCGGCLGALLLLGLLTGLLAYLGVQGYNKSTEEVSKVFFGDSPPKGYRTVFALASPIEMMLLLDSKRGRSLSVVREKLNDEYFEAYKEMTSAKVKKIAKEGIEQVASINPVPATVEGVVSLQLYGRSYPAVRLCYESKPTKCAPAVIVYVVTSSQHGISLIAQRLTPRSLDDTENIEKDYQSIMGELETLVQFSKFSEDLLIYQ